METKGPQNQVGPRSIKKSHTQNASNNLFTVHGILKSCNWGKRWKVAVVEVFLFSGKRLPCSHETHPFVAIMKCEKLGTPHFWVLTMHRLYVPSSNSERSGFLIFLYRFGFSASSEKHGLLLFILVFCRRVFLSDDFFSPPLELHSRNLSVLVTGAFSLVG